MNSLRGRVFWALKSFLLLMLLLIVVLFLIVPFVSARIVESGQFPSSFGAMIRGLQSCQSVVMHVFIYMYVAFFGSCIASFLNVVAWRVPRGRSILGSSHCPVCDHKLSMKDNVPVWGWLKNEGRCRHCQTPIAVRYLVVELLLGTVFLILFVPEIVWGGVNLPAAPKLARTGIEFVLFGLNQPLLATWGFHATLMASLFTFSAISIEHHRIPLSVVLVAVVFLVAIAGWFPMVIQVDWNQLPLMFRVSQMSLIQALTVMGAGSVTGILVGLALGSQSPGSTDDTLHITNSRINLTLSFMVVGLTLGWQAVLLVGGIWYFVKSLARQWIDGQKHRFEVSLLMLATLIFLMIWNLLF